MAGAEAWSAPGGTHGVLVVHGFTGSPQSMRPLAEALAAGGFAVELPLLPGHGRSVADMLETRWADWSAAAEDVYAELASRVDRVVVAGLSMGGTLTTWLAAEHPEIAGIVLVNPAVEPMADSFVDVLRGLVAEGHATMPAIGSDIADPDQRELAYDATPVEPLLSLAGAIADLHPRLVSVTCPVLLFTSTQDHVVPPSASDVLAGHVSGPVERVVLERSYHVATLDFDHGLIEERAVAFARRVTSA